MPLSARKRLGQHFLEPVWVNKVLGAIEPATTDTFLEIGPGRGALTLPLAVACARVIAVEVDRDLAAELRAEAPRNVEVVDGDFLTVDVAALVTPLWRPAPASPAAPALSPWAPDVLRVAGNLPYNASAPILSKLIRLYRDGMPLQDATLMLQREVADRVVAHTRTSAYGPLAIMMQLYAYAARVLTLPPGAFRPAPKVRSAVVRLSFHQPTVPLPDPDVFEALVRSLFSQRRKTVQNALRPFASERGLSATALLARARLEGRRRPEELDLAELAELAEVLVSARREAVL